MELKKYQGVSRKYQGYQYKNGHKVYWHSRSKKFYYEDGKEVIKKRQCPKCRKMPTKQGHDACIANLPGVEFACCGHGKEQGYIKFINGKVIRFDSLQTDTIK